MTKKPSERIQEIYNDLRNKYPNRELDNVIANYFQALTMYLDEQYQASKPCEHEWKEHTMPTFDPNIVENTGLKVCTKCRILQA